jgi:predicted GNAT superfamily acetyltransferase
MRPGPPFVVADNLPPRCSCDRTNRRGASVTILFRMPARFGSPLVESARSVAEDACAAAGIALEDAHDPAHARRAAAVLAEIWGAGSTGMIDPALLVAIAHAGNFVSVATIDGRAVGAAVGFCGPPGTPFHSHIVGLLPGATGAGRGRAIKLAQRAWCLERGIHTMTWTFDPLVARNARFNLRTLGARATDYLPDFYGDMTDALNAGQHSDRLFVRWDLDDDPPPREAHRAAVTSPVVLDEVDGRPVAGAMNGAARAQVAVPADIGALRRVEPDVAAQWRLALRRALAGPLSDGWSIAGFTDSGRYELRKNGTP